MNKIEPLENDNHSMQHPAEAERPAWRAILVRTWRRSIADRLTTAASSVAFYVLLGSIPGLAAIVLLYGQLADANDVKQFSQMIAAVVPQDIAEILDRQIRRLVAEENSGGRSLPASFAWIAFVLWSANRGMQGVVDALNIVYDRAEERVIFRRLAVTMIMTICMIAFIAVSIFAIVILPLALSLLSVDTGTAATLGLVRWPALLLLVTGTTALLLRFGPSRRDTYWPAIFLGSIVSAILWLAMSFLFSWYAQNVANFSALYGSLGSVVAFMTWLWLSALTVLIGAELDASVTAANSKRPLAGTPAENEENRETDHGDKKQSFRNRGGSGGDVGETNHARRHG
jgi:membrane protein